MMVGSYSTCPVRKAGLTQHGEGDGFRGTCQKSPVPMGQHLFSIKMMESYSFVPFLKIGVRFAGSSHVYPNHCYLSIIIVTL